MKTNLKFFVACFVFCIDCSFLHAERYIIVYMPPNQGHIYINNNPAHVGSIFDDKNDIIRWTSKNQSFRARLLPERKSFNDRVFAASKAQKGSITFIEYLRGLYKTLGTKGTGGDRIDSFLLLDSLSIGPLIVRTETQFEAKWNDGEKKIIKRLPASIDKSEVYITRDLFSYKNADIIDLEIWGTDNFGSYRFKTIRVELLEQ